MRTKEFGNPPIRAPHPLDLEHFAFYPKRQYVPPELRPWEVRHDHYRPPVFQTKNVAGLARRDPDQSWRTMADETRSKLAAMGYPMGINGPQNGMGRTGLAGGGGWPRLGPNYSAHLQLIADTPQGLYSLMVVRKDNKKMLAFPGNLIDITDSKQIKKYSDLYDSELRNNVSVATAIRATREETFIDFCLNDIKTQLVYSGPTGGVRGTDHRWAETSAHTALIEVKELPTVKASRDAYHAAWIPLSRQLFGIGEHQLMNANHGQMLRLAIGALGLTDRIANIWEGRHLHQLGQLPDETGLYLEATIPREYFTAGRIREIMKETERE